MMRVLKPNGLLLLTTEYNPTWSKPYSEDGFYRVYDEQTINELLDGLKVEEKKMHTTPEEGQFTTLFLKVRK